MASLSTRRNAGQQIVLPTTGQGGEALSENFAWMDALQGGVKDITDTPPGAPSEGDLYILSGTPTGAWSAQAANDVALYYNSGWLFLTPPASEAGLTLYIIDEMENYRWDGSAWNLVTVTASIQLNDNEKAFFGTGSDATIYYNATDLIIDPQEVGTGDILLAPNGGNIGIGTSSPGALLHVSGGDILLDNTYSIQWKDSGGTARDILTVSSADNVTLRQPAGSSGDIYLGSGSLFALKPSSGYLGLGQASPIAELQITTASTVNADLLVHSASDAAGYTAAIHFGISSSNTTAALTSGTRSADIIATRQADGSIDLSFRASDGSTNNEVMVIDGSAGTVSVTGGMSFLDNEKLFFGTGSDATIYYDGTNMYIDPQEVGTGNLLLAPNGGNVGIGTASPSTTLTVDGTTTNSTTGVLQVTNQTSTLGEDAMRINMPNATSGALRFTNSAAQYWRWFIGASGEMRFDSNDGTSKYYMSNTGRLRIQTDMIVGATSGFAENATLEVQETSAGGITVPFAINNQNASTGTGTQFTFGNTTSIAADTNGLTKLRTVRQADGSNDFTILQSPGSAATPVENFFIDGSTGNVGIGTTTPDEKLEVIGTAQASAIIIDEPSNPDARLEFHHGGSLTSAFITEAGAGLFQFEYGGQVVASIGDSGSAAFGTSNSPVSRLYVYENNAGTNDSVGVTIEQDGTGDAMLHFLLTATERWVVGIDNSDGDKFKIADGTSLDSGTAVTIDTTGNVGIGNTSPGASLDVEGTFKSGDSSTNTLSGTYSAIVGGASNTNNTGSRNVIIGGSTNEIKTGATTDSAIIGGASNDITSTGFQNAIIGGGTNIISGTANNAAIIGSDTSTASGNSSFVGGGRNVTASGVGSAIIGTYGYAGTSNVSATNIGSSIIGSYSYSNGSIVASGFSSAIIGSTATYNTAVYASGASSVVIASQSYNAAQVKAGGQNSAVIATQNGYVTQTQSAVIGGYNNRITTGSRNLILGGTTNEIKTGATTDSVIIGGANNDITSTSTRNFIAGGSANVISGIAFESTIIGGSGNTATAARATIIGSYQTTAVGNYSAIIGSSAGNGTLTTQTGFCAIIASQSGTQGAVTASGYFAIILGSYGYYKGSVTSSGACSSIISSKGGYNTATTNAGYYSSIIASATSTITGGSHSLLAATTNSTMQSNYSVIIGGTGNTLNTGNRNAIIGGTTNEIKTGATVNSAIVGGTYNDITSYGDNHAIIAGNNNVISGASNSFSTIIASFGSVATASYAIVLGGTYCTASATHALAHGNSAIASASGAIQFGTGNNSVANTLRVGTGPRLDGTAPTQNELLTTDANGIIKSTPTIITSETGSAVNQITVSDAVTLNGPTIAATGTDTNIDLNLTPKGTGGVVCGGSASGQSTIASGLVVNDDAGATANDDFRVETTSQANAFVVDASADKVTMDVVLQLPYLGAAPSGLTNGMVWMESDGLHIYYAGAEKVVAGV